MEVQARKLFVFRFSENDLYLFVRLFETVLGVGPAPRPFDETERATLMLHWQDLSRTLETAHDDDPPEPSAEEPSAQQGDDSRPVCPVHQKPMWHQQGKHGWFWSCHQRNEDGSYCNYRPVKNAA